jgi:uncharacterized protein YggE
MNAIRSPIPQTTLLVIALVAFGIRCSGDRKNTNQKQPEFIGSTAGSAPRGSASAPELLASSGGSSGAILSPLANAPSSTSARPPGGLTVSHTEPATLPADQAAVVVTSPPRAPLVGASPSLSSDEQGRITSALTAVGVEKVDLSFETNSNPFPSVMVRVPLADLPASGKKITDAVESVIGRSQSAGLRFGLTDCGAKLGPVVKKTFDGARADAQAMAAAGSLTLGPVLTVSQSLGLSSAYPSGADPCGLSRTSSGPPVADIVSFDSAPEVKVNLSLTVNYSVGGDSGGAELTTAATGSATAKADEGYIVVGIPNQGGPGGPQPMAKKDRDELVQKLRALKIEDKDISVESQPFGGLTTVSVEVGLAGLPQTGKDVVSAVESVLGRSQLQGVWFTHSNCGAVLAEAQKQAIAAAKADAASLADAAGLKLGNIVGLGESFQSSGLYGAQATNYCNTNIAQQVASRGPNAGLKSFDADPQFTVPTTVLVTFSTSGS